MNKIENDKIIQFFINIILIELWKVDNSKIKLKYTIKY